MELSKKSAYGRIPMWVYGCSTSTISTLHNVGPCVGLAIPTLVERKLWDAGLVLFYIDMARGEEQDNIKKIR